MAELTRVVAADNDEVRYLGDGFGPTGTVQVAPPVLRVGYFAATTQWEGVGIRLRNITIPKGVIIDEAKLTLIADTSFSMAGCNCEISAQDADNPSDFTGEDWDSLKTRWDGRTSAQVDWDNIAAWVKDSSYDSPDIKSVIQEIIGRSGWASGNAIVIFWDDWSHESDTLTQRTRSAYPYNIDNAKAVQLYVKYSIVAPTTTTDPATLVETTMASLNGTLDDSGGEACDCGFEYGLTTGYGTTTPTQSKTTGQTFLQAITGLLPGTLYHFRAIATNEAGTSYGSDATFATLAVIPTVDSNPATDITRELASLNGELTYDGGEACDCGFEYGETTAYGTTTPTESKETGETFSQAITGLTPGKHYHFRAIATNDAGTSYGSDRGFFAKGGKKGNPNIDQLIYQHVERMER